MKHDTSLSIARGLGFLIGVFIVGTLIWLVFGSVPWAVIASCFLAAFNMPETIDEDDTGKGYRQ